MCLPAFDHMHRFLPGMFVALDAQILTFAVHHHPRAHGASHYKNAVRLKEAFIDVLGVLWLRRRLVSRRPDSPS